jgi:methionyl-tRNA synthetase
MSKSLGNVIDPFQVMDVYGADALRYYLMREVPFGQDGNVSTEGFEKRYTSELANEYGNLASRTLAMIGRFRDGVIPDADVAPELAGFEDLAQRVAARFDGVEITGALDDIWQLVRRLNQYVQDEEPWKLAKDDAEAEHLDRVLYGLAEGLRVVSVLVHPFVPDAAARLLDALGAGDLSLEGAKLGAVAGGSKLGELPPLFPKVEPDAA